ncbi:MAG: hypothetical protein D6683_01550 [Actinomyces sp.]|nr:MAG: hypothetical protein D6683_01550 [Actinomyces sp.]
MNYVAITETIRTRHRHPKAPAALRTTIYANDMMIEVSVNEEAYVGGKLFVDRVTHYGLSVFDFDVATGGMAYRSELSGLFASAQACDEALRHALKQHGRRDIRTFRKTFTDYLDIPFHAKDDCVFFELDANRLLLLAYDNVRRLYYANVFDSATKVDTGMRGLRSAEQVSAYVDEAFKFVPHV